MAGRGVLFALSAEEAAALLAADGDEDAVMEVIEEIEERWDEDRLTETDKAWDAIHRALTDGQLGWANGSAPLNLTILGGRRLSTPDHYIAVYKTAADVVAVAEALKGIDEVGIRERYERIVPADYAPEYGDEDAAYTAEWYGSVRTFYISAAERELPVAFTTDQ